MGTKRFITMLLAGVFLAGEAGEALAQTKNQGQDKGKGQDKNKGKSKDKGKDKRRNCFTKREHANEGEIRYAVRLREYAWICDATPFYAETWEPWGKVEKANDDKFAKLKEERNKAFEREFPDNFKTLLAAWDGRIVHHYRYHPMNAVMCDELKEQLGDIIAKGYKELQRQAVKNKPEVRMDYKVCPGK